MKWAIAKPIKKGDGYSLGQIGEAIFDSGFKIEYEYTAEAYKIAEFCFSKVRPKTLLDEFMQ